MVHGFRGFSQSPWSITWADLILVGACSRGDSPSHNGQETESDRGTGSRQNLHRPVSGHLPTAPLTKFPKASWGPSIPYQSLRWSNWIQTQTGSVHLGGLGRLNTRAKPGTVRLLHQHHTAHRHRPTAGDLP